MPEFRLNAFAGSAFGFAPSEFPYTGNESPANDGLELIVIDDDDVFDDEASGGGQTVDRSSQVLGNSFGSVSAGQVIQSVYSWDVLNNATGVSGKGYLIRIYNSTNPNRPGNQNGEYYFVFTMTVSEGDELTFSNPHLTGQVPYANLAPYVPNSAPIVASALSDHASPEDGPVSYHVPADAFSDPDGDTLTYTAVLNGGDPLPAWLNFDTATRSFSGTPPTDFNGTLSLTVTTSDGTLAASDTFDLVITAVDDPAVAQEDRFVAAESETLVRNVFGDSGFGIDFDVDGPPLAVGAAEGQPALVGVDYQLASGATLRIETNGSLVYKPGPAFGLLAAPGSGASNTRLSDNFEYTLVGGGTASVTVFVYGVDSADRLLGTAGNDNLSAGAFDDVLLGFAGGDVLNGGEGGDTASYELDDGAVFVNLTLGEGWGNAAHGDSYLSIENVIGTAYNDFIIGESGDNRLDGRAGNDILIGALGADVLIGGSGIDAASYEDNAGAVFVNLSLGRGWNNAAHEDSYENIENLVGGLFDDFFIGDAGANRLQGGMGADTLVGDGGADVFAFTYAPGAGSEWGSPNVDTILDFTSGQDMMELAASAFAGMAAGPLAASAFVLGTEAADVDDRILYDQATGNLWFDADGSGGGTAVLFAALDTKPGIVAADFVIV